MLIVTDTRPTKFRGGDYKFDDVITLLNFISDMVKPKITNRNVKCIMVEFYGNKITDRQDILKIRDISIEYGINIFVYLNNTHHIFWNDSADVSYLN